MRIALKNPIKSAEFQVPPALYRSDANRRALSRHVQQICNIILITLYL